MDEKTKNFIEKARLVHGDKYDYSKVKYINNHTKICIICSEHGEFWTQPCVHLNGSICKKCFDKTKGKSKRLTVDNFIERAKQIHKNKYEYSKVLYTNNRTKVCIICPEHGEFLMTPDSHLKGRGCPKCGIINAKNKNRLSQEKFLEKVKLVHGEKYDYKESVYVNTDTKIKIICPEHGEFWQTPHHHLKGVGCPMCGRKNISENKIYNFIKKNFPDAIRQYNDKFLIKNGHKQYIDIYIPSIKIGIEYQGRQHFVPVYKYGGISEFEKTKERDLRKYNKSKENGVKILYFSYEKDTPTNYIDKIFIDENKLLEELKSYDYRL